MITTNLPEGHHIRALEFISKQEYDQVRSLMELCCSQEQINLKLELDYKLHLASMAEEKAVASSERNEFLYYVENKLVSYLGISCFDGITGELAGMTHPDDRRRGIFSRLLEQAQRECQNRAFKKLLILADGNSETGMQYMKDTGFAHEHSEYRMKRLSAESAPLSEASSVTLRPACREDEAEIARMNFRIFNDAVLDENTGEPFTQPLAEEPENQRTYMVELDGERIGKINVEYYDDYAFLFGFGIKSEYRGKGYGREALNAAIKLIEDKGIKVTELDVVCTNGRALTLYESCGFKEVSVMNYYSVS